MKPQVKRSALRQGFEQARYPILSKANVRSSMLSWNPGAQEYRNAIVQAEFAIWCNAIESTGVYSIIQLVRGIVTDLKDKKMLTPAQVKHSKEVLNCIKEII